MCWYSVVCSIENRTGSLRLFSLAASVCCTCESRQHFLWSMRRHYVVMFVGRRRVQISCTFIQVPFLNVVNSRISNDKQQWTAEQSALQRQTIVQLVSTKRLLCSRDRSTAEAWSRSAFRLTGVSPSVYIYICVSDRLIYGWTDSVMVGSVRWSVIVPFANPLHGQLVFG